MAWRGESRRHGLARKGVKTNGKYQYKTKGKPKLRIGLPTHSKEQIVKTTRLANQKEWIAELNMDNNDVIIDDIQISTEIDHSYLHWNAGDEVINVGYIHYHPKKLIPEFSAQDFVLAINIHETRKNKRKYPYTLMGLVTEEGGKIKATIYALKPKKNRVKDFEGLYATERDLRHEINSMKKSGELMELKEMSGVLA